MGTGKTGGHWKPCNVGSVEAHNERQRDYLESIKKAGLNLYFFPQLSNNNSHWVSSHERYSDKTVAEVFDEMKKLYQQKTGQPPQLGEKTKKSKKTGREYKCAGWSPIREMCVPIKADTQIEDFDFLRKWAAKYGIEIMRIDLHKDEGYHDKETGEYKMNYHAHVVASFIDWETGKTVKAGKEAMSEMQTILAISLGMERGERKADTGKRYLTHQEYRGMMEEIGEKKKLLQEADEKLNHFNATIKRAETKLKGLNTMLSNLEEQKDAIEIDIVALEEERDNGNKEAEKKLADLNEQFSKINDKIEERNQQISDAKEQLRQLSIRKHSLQNDYDETMRQYNKILDKKEQIDNELDEADRQLIEKRQEIEKADQTGELARYKRYIDDRQRIIFRRWPAAEAATRAIYERGSSRTATQFSPQQAMLVEQAISTSGTTRQEAAADLCSLVQKEFEDNRTWQAWVEAAFSEVMDIANHVHPLSAFLQDQNIGGGGGPSHITDLTGWDGKKRR